MAQMNLQMKNTLAASSGTRAEDDVLIVPTPHLPGYTKQIGPTENSDHSTVTIQEPQVCRICDFEEEEHDADEVLVELGCSCKGHLSRMHRKCILKWYGVRMLLEKLYKCELCNADLHINAQLIVARGVTDHENGGRASLMQALKSSLASYAPHIEVEHAANYKELVQLLLVERTEWFRHRYQSRQVVVNNEAAAPQGMANSRGQESEPFPPPTSRRAVALLMAASILGVGVFLFLIHHFYGNAAFRY